MLTDEQIRWGWLFLLGREPEGAAVYEAHRSLPDIETLRRVLLQSTEFRAKLSRNTKSVGQLILAAAPTSPATAPAKTMRRMFERTQDQWTRLGESEPYWSVLTNASFKSDKIEQNRDHFFKTGEQNAQAVRAALARNRLTANAAGVCAELGCGVGRVSVHLARMFAHVDGYDISPGNLALAKRNAEAFGVSNARFHLTRRIDDYDRMAEYDFFFSVIVLQHNPPPIQYEMLKRIFAKARKNALLYFQVQVYALRYRFDAEEYLESPVATLDMHVLPQQDVFQLLADADCRVVEVMEDNASGHPEWQSVTFVAQKR